MTTSFSAQLRTMTVPDHDAAQHVPVVNRLLGGELPIDAYAVLAGQHFFVYEVLEAAAAAMRDDPVAGNFTVAELTRLPALAADLRFLLGAEWRDRIEAGAATRDYCDRLREVCFTWPGGFVAHHYTRYLGDLSGGQAIAGAITRIYGLTPPDGVRFYDFSALGDLTAFKQRYRALLDEAPWDDAERERIVVEIGLAYAHNTALLVDLGRAFA